MSMTDIPDRDTEDCEHANREGITETELSSFADLFVLLSRCFEPPDERFHAALDSDAFETQLQEVTATLDVEVPSMPDPEPLSEMRRAYRRSFEAYEGPYASPVESVYEEWWDGTHREITSGPAAHDMRSRYEAIDAEIPDQYPPDHVALLLEYASLLLETDAPLSERVAAFEAFADEHFDWIPDFEERVEETCEEPFYRWAVTVLVRVCGRTQNRLTRE